MEAKQPETDISTDTSRRCVMMLGYLLLGFTAVVGLVIYLGALRLVRARHSSPPIVVSGRVVRRASARRAPQGRIAEVRRGYPGGPASRAMTGEPDRSIDILYL